MARRSQWRLWTLSATLIVLLRAGWIAVMTVVLQNGSARQLTPCELAELNGEAPAHSGRQSRPGHDRHRKSLLHGASRPSGSTPAMRRGRAAASPPTGVPLQTFLRGWFEGALAELKTHLRGAQVVLRSKTSELVRQEFWGLLLAHFAVRGLMHEAALRVDEDPDRLSFLHAVRVVRRKLPLFAALPPSGQTRPA